MKMKLKGNTKKIRRTYTEGKKGSKIIYHKYSTIYKERRNVEIEEQRYTWHTNC